MGRGIASLELLKSGRLSLLTVSVLPMDPEKLLDRLRRGSIRNVRFKDMVRMLEAFGFKLLRTHGSHHIYGRPDVPELINLQNVGGEAKPYQVRQFLKLVERYPLRLEDKT